MESSYRQRFNDWLIGGGAAARTIPELLDELCRFLNFEGFAVYRCHLSTETVHPLIASMRHVWFAEPTDPDLVNPGVMVERHNYRFGEALVDEALYNPGWQRNPQYLTSPMRRVETTGELYEPIRAPGEAQPFPMFETFARMGCTAFYAKRLNGFSGLSQKLGLATRRPGGLSDEQRFELQWSVELFTLRLDTLIERMIKETLARSYIGVDPGRRVCDGMIARGAIVSTEAAVWFSDLRGFTAIGDTVDQAALIESLNDYFDTVVPPIYAAGGEVLKYIGDAVLAIFPHDHFPDAGAACRAAIGAAREASGLLARINARRADFKLPLLSHGVGLASGTVSYGNIGARERLDFTVIGATVNLASRIEALTRTLGETVLCSEHFIRLAGSGGGDRGRHRLKGITDPVAIHAPLAEAVA